MTSKDTVWKDQNNLYKKIRSLQDKIGKDGVEDIIEKLKGIFLCMQNVHLSVVSRDMVLIGVSKSQEYLFPEDYFDGDQIECYRFYKGLGTICQGCLSREAMNTKLIQFSSGKAALKRKKILGDLNKDVIITDSFFVPCGKKDDKGFSHCIDIVLDVTDRERERMAQRFHLHKFTRLLYKGMQEKYHSQSLRSLLLFGSLFSLREKNIRSQILILSNDDPSEDTFYRLMSIEKNDNSNAIWDAITKTKQARLNLRKYISEMEISIIEEEQSLKAHGITAELYNILLDDHVKCFGNYTKVAVLIKGAFQYSFPSFILIIEKKPCEYNNIFDFDDLAAISNYATFCRNAVVNWRLQSKNKKIGEEYKRLVDLSTETASEAYVAGMVIGSTHNAAKIWDQLTCMDMLIDMVDVNKASKPEVKNLIHSYNIAKEGMNNYFKRMNKWREMGVTILRGINAYYIVNQVSARYINMLKKVTFRINITKEDKDLAVLGDEKYFEEVVENILTNAIDAVKMVKNPKVTITIGKQNKDLPICIKVEDNGHGVTEEDIDSIWMPNYTTKKHGTGRGLAFVKYTVETIFKGKITCFSEPGEYTSFTIHLRKS